MRSGRRGGEGSWRGGGGGGMARMRLPYLCKLPESFAPRARESVSVRERRRRWGVGERWNQWSDGDDAAAARVGLSCGGTFQTLLIRRAGGRVGRRVTRRDGVVCARVRERMTEKEERKKRIKLKRPFVLLEKEARGFSL